MSLAVVVTLPDQFAPMAQVELLEEPVHVISAACARGRLARKAAMNAG
jgi:hypothetical protein